MPALVMRVADRAACSSRPAGSSCAARSRYGATRGVPWGISESAYNARDLELTYQYSNFGVPGLGLKRGLSEDLVIAPYATALAAMVDPARGGARTSRASPTLGARGALRLLRGARLHARARLPEGATLRASCAPTWRTTRA